MATLERTITELRDLEPSYVSGASGAGGSTRERTVELVGRIQRETGQALRTIVRQSRGLTAADIARRFLCGPARETPPVVTVKL
jgi:hypothetical protein